MPEAAQETAAETANELEQPMWSVISFERREGGGLTYARAREILQELDSRHVSGLAIVTDAAAEKLRS